MHPFSRSPALRAATSSHESARHDVLYWEAPRGPHRSKHHGTGSQAGHYGRRRLNIQPRQTAADFKTSSSTPRSVAITEREKAPAGCCCARLVPIFSRTSACHGGRASSGHCSCGSQGRDWLALGATKLVACMAGEVVSQRTQPAQVTQPSGLQLRTASAPTDKTAPQAFGSTAVSPGIKSHARNIFLARTNSLFLFKWETRALQRAGERGLTLMLRTANAEKQKTESHSVLNNSQQARVSKEGCPGRCQMSGLLQMYATWRA